MGDLGQIVMVNKTLLTFSCIPLRKIGDSCPPRTAELRPAEAVTDQQIGVGDDNRIFARLRAYVGKKRKTCESLVSQG